MLLACQKGIEGRGSLIRVFPVCYSDRHFVNSSSDNQHFIWEQKKESVRCLRTFTLKLKYMSCNNVVCVTSKGSDQHAHTRSLIRAFASRLNILWLRLLTEHHLECLSLKGGCTGSSESTLVKMPHCWKSCVMAHMLIQDIDGIVCLLSGCVRRSEVKRYVEVWLQRMGRGSGRRHTQRVALCCTRQRLQTR